MTEKKASGID